MWAGRWPVASLGVPHGGVGGRAGGVRSVQVGQLRAHVQGVGVPDGDLTEDRGVGGHFLPRATRACLGWRPLEGQPTQGDELTRLQRSQMASSSLLSSPRGLHRLGGSIGSMGKPR